MSKETEAKPGIGHNINQTIKAVKPIMDEMDRIATAREGLNAGMNMCIADLEAKGLNRHAVRMARQLAKIDPDKREGFEISFDIVRQALGIEAQAEMFDAAGNPTTDDAKAAE